MTISLPQAVRRELDKVAIASMNGPDLTDATLGQYRSRRRSVRAGRARSFMPAMLFWAGRSHCDAPPEIVSDGSPQNNAYNFRPGRTQP